MRQKNRQRLRGRDTIRKHGDKTDAQKPMRGETETCLEGNFMGNDWKKPSGGD